MLRTIYWFSYFWLSLVSYIPPYLRLRKYDEPSQRQMAFNRAKGWSNQLLKIAGTEIVIEGEENLAYDENVLVVANHQSNFDIPIMISILPKPAGFMAKVELSKMPFVSGWMKALGCVFMDRNDIRQQVKSIGEGANRLKSGHTLVLFPEGTRSKTGALGDFKAGGLKLATRSNAKILPISIEGSINIMQRDSLIIKPALVKIVVHPVMILESKDTSVEMARVKEIIEKGIRG